MCVCICTYVNENNKKSSDKLSLKNDDFFSILTFDVKIAYRKFRTFSNWDLLFLLRNSFLTFFSLVYSSVLALFLCLLRWFSHGDLDSQPAPSVSVQMCVALCTVVCRHCVPVRFSIAIQNRFNSAFLRNATVWCARAAATAATSDERARQSERAQENFRCLCTVYIRRKPYTRLVAQ